MTVWHVIIGAGAVGGTVAALLAESGREVLVLARGAHAAVLRDEGLELTLPGRCTLVRLDVVETVDDLALRPDDVLHLCTKSQHAEPLVRALAARAVGARTAGDVLALLCVQNGVANEPRALRYFGNVLGVCVALPATHLQPGKVQAEGAPLTGLFEVGCYPRGVDAVVETVCADLTVAGIVATPREDVMAWKRTKLLNNLANALEALCGRPATSDAAGDELWRRARQEGAECFAAAGLSVIDEDEWTAHRGGRVEVAPGSARAGGSSWQSLLRRSGSIEADFLNGEISRLGRLHAVPTPVNTLLQVRANAAASAGAPPGSTTTTELLAALDA